MRRRSGPSAGRRARSSRGPSSKVFSRALNARARSPGSGWATGVGATPSSIPRSPSPAMSRASRPGPEGPTTVVAWVSELGHGEPAVEHLQQRGVLAVDGEKRLVAQVAQDPALVVRAAVNLLESPPRPQPRAQRAVAAHRGGRAQPKRVALTGRRWWRWARRTDPGPRPRPAAPAPRGTARRQRTLHPQCDVAESDHGPGGEPSRLGQGLAGDRHPEPRPGVADHRAVRGWVDTRVQPRDGAVLELHVRGLAAADRHRVADREPHAVGQHQHKRPRQR